MVKKALNLLECVRMVMNLRIPGNTNLLISMIADRAYHGLAREDEPLSLRERLKGPFNAHGSFPMDDIASCSDGAIENNEY